jgi:hypothetical protein
MELAYNDLLSGDSVRPWLRFLLLTTVVELLRHPSGPNVCTLMPKLACKTSIFPMESKIAVRGVVNPPAIFVNFQPSATTWGYATAATPGQELGKGKGSTEAVGAAVADEVAVAVELADELGGVAVADSVVEAVVDSALLAGVDSALLAGVDSALLVVVGSALLVVVGSALLAVVVGWGVVEEGVPVLPPAALVAGPSEFFETSSSKSSLPMLAKS